MAARCTAALWISHEELFMTVAFKIKVDGLVDAITIRKIEYPPPPRSTAIMGISKKLSAKSGCQRT